MYTELYKKLSQKPEHKQAHLFRLKKSGGVIDLDVQQKINKNQQTIDNYFKGKYTYSLNSFKLFNLNQLTLQFDDILIYKVSELRAPESALTFGAKRHLETCRVVEV